MWCPIINLQGFNSSISTVIRFDALNWPEEATLFGLAGLSGTIYCTYLTCELANPGADLVVTDLLQKF